MFCFGCVGCVGVTCRPREITIKEKQTSSLTKTFQFDKVFGIQSKQIDVYRSVVEPLIPQVGRKNQLRAEEKANRAN